MDIEKLAKQGVLKKILEMATEEFAKKLKGKKTKGVEIEISTLVPAKKRNMSDLRRQLMEE